MAIQNKTTLKGYFNDGDRPNESNFTDLIDSAANKVDDLASTAEAQAGTLDSKFMSPLKVKQAITANLPSASETAKGIIEIATVAEAQAGTDTVRAVTAAGAKAAAVQFAPVKTVNNISPVSGNITIAIPPNENVAWAAGTGFATGISSYDSASSVRYKRRNGVVFLDGKIKGGTSQTNGTTYVLFVLPSGFWPTRKMSFAVIKGDTATTSSEGRIDIDTNGNVYGVLYSNVWTSISGISFPVD